MAMSPRASAPLLVLERDGGRLVERPTLTGDESAELRAPFPVTVATARLG